MVFYIVSRIFCRGLVAQSVEHRPFKAGVQGSSPCQLTFFVSRRFLTNRALSFPAVVFLALKDIPFKAVSSIEGKRLIHTPKQQSWIEPFFIVFP